MPDPSHLRTVRLTVARSVAGTAREHCIRGPLDTTWGQVATALGLTGSAYVGAVTLPADHRVGDPPLVNGAVVSDVPAQEPPAHLLRIVATEGPCVGRCAALTDSRLTVGRGAGNQLVLNDPGLSREHCELRVAQGRAVVRDLGSTNGTVVDGSPVGIEPVELKVGQRLRIGGTTLAVERVPRPTADLNRSGTDETGRHAVHRPPRRPLLLADVELEVPGPPKAPTRRGFPWVSALVPLVMAGVMVALLHNALFAMFALLSPVMVVAQYAGDRVTGRGTQRTDTAEHVRAMARHAQDRVDALRVEQAARRRIAPPVSQALHDAVHRTSGAWHRGPHDEDYLVCRLGTGPAPSRVTVRDSTEAPRRLTVREVPATVSFARDRVVGLSGAHRHRSAYAVCAQFIAWHSPRDLQILVLCAAAEGLARWAALTPAPHVTPHPASAHRVMLADPDDQRFTDAIAELAHAPTETDRVRSDLRPPHALVILDGPVAQIPAVADLLTQATRYGLTFLCLDDAGRLPAACTVNAHVDAVDLAMLDGVRYRPDLPSADLLARTARALAGLVDADPGDTEEQLPGAVPYDVLVHDELNLDIADPAAVQRHWHSEAGTTRALLGRGTDGATWVDLASDGPHALVAGTTGAGKSELLQTLIASLALANPPDRLSFVLIDYKGGAAFQDCAQLPHTLGLVTDLDAHLTSRALRSLEAEVRRRERLLATVGAADIDAYLGCPGVAALSRLCIVIDEFRVLSEELPDFVNGLVRIAAVGRSLGVHLILATQRPAGVVSGDMRANVNLRIALRVRDVADSHDVIDSDAAVRIPATCPGRAVVRTGGGRPRLVQTAWTGTPLATATVPLLVAPVHPATGGPLWPTALADPSTGTALSVLARSARIACEQRAIHPPDSPWLAPLPDVLRVPPGRPATRTLSGRAATGDTQPIGLLDLPDEQEQAIVGWDPSLDGHLAVVGGPRSGRTSAARMLLQQVCARHSAHDLHVYVLDGSGSLAQFADAPHCGGVLRRDELTRTLRLVDWLTSCIRSRQGRPEAREPRILLVVDGWEVFQELSNEHTVGELEDRLMQVCRDGAGHGISVVATGGRNLLTGRVATLFTTSLAMRMADPSDLLLAGLRSSRIPADMPPGRALLLPEGQEVQLGLAEPAPARYDGAGESTVHRIGTLPDRVTLGEVPAVGPDEVSLGVDVDGPATLPTGQSGEAGWLVCGPPRSGRTTSLVTLAHGLLSRRAVGWLGVQRPPDMLPDRVHRMSPDDSAGVGRWCTEHPDGVVLIDDLDQLAGMPAEDALTEYLARNRSTGAIVCGSGAAPELAAAFRGLAPALRRRQTGILLQPGRHDGEVFTVRLGSTDARRPGRGVLVVRGQVREVQVAVP